MELHFRSLVTSGSRVGTAHEQDTEELSQEQTVHFVSTCFVNEIKVLNLQNN